MIGGTTARSTDDKRDQRDQRQDQRMIGEMRGVMNGGIIRLYINTAL